LTLVEEGINYLENLDGDMSFSDFLEKKISYKPPVLAMDQYKEELSQRIFSLQKTGGLSRHFLNLPRIGRILQEMNYPDRDKFLIIIASGNSNKIRKLSLEFHEWSKNNSYNKDVVEIENYLVKLKSFLYFNKELGIDDAKQIVESKMKETEFEAKSILQSVDSMIRLSDWGHLDITIEPIFEESEDLVAHKFKICVGKNHFIYSKNMFGFETKPGKIDESQVLESQKLLWLQNKMSNNPLREFVKLYFVQPQKNRKIFEELKKNLSLGRPVTVPANIRFYDYIPEVQEREDVWKIKMERKYLIENSNKYEILGDDAPFRWIEMIGDCYEK